MYEPLAERMRPKSLNDYIGQKHLVGEGAVIRRMIESGKRCDKWCEGGARGARPLPCRR